MASEEIVQSIRATITDCLKTPIEALVRHANWGTINFDKAKPDLERLFAIIRPLETLPLEIVPQDVAETINSYLINSKYTIEKIRSFSIEKGDSPASQRDSMCTDFTREVDQLFAILTPWVPYLAYAHGDVERNIAQLAASVNNAKSIVEAGTNDVEQKKKELDSIISAAREASASVGVAHYTADFSNEASEREKSARYWLFSTGMMAALTAGTAVALMFYGVPENATTAIIVNRVVSKIVLLTLLLGATIWCGRIYKAMMHQAATNKHRANSLKTFQAFTKAASDEASRNAVLLETTRSIFALAPSGYLDSTDSSPDGGTKVVEIFKGAAQAVGSGTK